MMITPAWSIGVELAELGVEDGAVLKSLSVSAYSDGDLGVSFVFWNESATRCTDADNVGYAWMVLESLERPMPCLAMVFSLGAAAITPAVSSSVPVMMASAPDARIFVA